MTRFKGLNIIVAVVSVIVAKGSVQGITYQKIILDIY